MSRPLRTSAAALLGLLALAACTADDGEQDPADDATAQAAETELRVDVASFDLHVGEQQRLLIGVATMDQGLIAHGEIDIAVGPLDEDDPEQAVVSQETTARFLPVPGDEPEGGGEQPTVLVGEPGTGVYEARVDLDEPGLWALQVTAELADGTTRTGSTVFPQRQPGGLAEGPQVPAVGDEAPRSTNLTVDDVDGTEVLPIMVDSRAGEDTDVPDPHIHDITIADAIEDGRPVVALFATPRYCMSRFCGPITETFAELAEQYEDRAEFVHVEVWRDFDAQELNEAAAEWIQTEAGGNEPWTFLIDDEGTIVARWDNVLDLEELRHELEQLPAVTHTEGGDE
jgi:hypothetical protein